MTRPSICRCLAAANPDTYLPDLAMTLNNLGNLYCDRHDVAAAQAACDEAFHIYRAWPRPTRTPYLPKVATTLNNLGNLYRDRHERKPPPRPSATRALHDSPPPGRRQPRHAYLPDLAMTLNNLAVLYSDRHDLAAAQAAYDEAPRRFTAAWPGPIRKLDLPKFSRTAVNLSIFYLQNLPDRDKSLAHGEALAAAWRLWRSYLLAREYARAILQIVEAWGRCRSFFEETLKTTETN